MSSKINEKGNRYGKLVVVKESSARSDNHVCWRCRCDCGKFIVASGRALREGTTTSCGCRPQPGYAAKKATKKTAKQPSVRKKAAKKAAKATQKIAKQPSVRKKAATATKKKAVSAKKRVYRRDGTWYMKPR